MDDQVAQNKRRSYVLLGLFFLVVATAAWAVSYLFGFGPIGAVVALVIAVGLSAGAWFGSDRVALSVARARPADPTDFARLHNLVEGLCIAGGIPKPAVYVIDDVAPNAFATGRSPEHASIAVTTGLLEMMNRVELEAVLAHELSHIKNDDVLVATIAVTCVGAVAVLADLGIRTLWWNGGRAGRDDPDNGGGPAAVFALVGFGLLILSPIIARLLQFAVSRRRESLADVSAVELTRYPPGLVAALEKLRDDTTVVAGSSRATAHLWIEAPVARVESEGRLSRWNRMFDTHPPIEERIAALREL